MNETSLNRFELLAKIRRSRVAFVSLIFVCLLVAVALLAPLIANDKPIVAKSASGITFPVLSGDIFDAEEHDFEWALYPPVPFSPNNYDLDAILLPPSTTHLLGTDGDGRDILSQLIWGSRVSLSVGLVAMGIAAVIGICMGLMAGFFGGMTDMLISRFLEVMLCFPTFFLILAVLAFVGPSIYNIMIVIGLVGWTPIARLVRGEVLRLRSLQFVTAARATGSRRFGIIFRHLLPNALSPALVSISFGIASAILAEAALSFLGFGVPPDVPSWGGMLSDARNYIDIGWWLTLIPGSAIFLTVMAYNFIGETIRDAIDPNMKA